MLSLSSLIAFIPMGLGLVILGVAIITAVVDSRGKQQPRPHTGEAAVGPDTRSKAA